MQLITYSPKLIKVSPNQITTLYILSVAALVLSARRPLGPARFASGLDNSSNLDKHKKIHSGEKSHICKTCQFSAASTRDLKSHIARKHVKEQSHQCNQCNFVFVTSSELQVHMRTHTGERPFNCNQCLKTYTKKWSLTKHSKGHQNAL